MRTVLSDLSGEVHEPRRDGTRQSRTTVGAWPVNIASSVSIGLHTAQVSARSSLSQQRWAPGPASCLVTEPSVPRAAGSNPSWRMELAGRGTRFDPAGAA